MGEKEGYMPFPKSFETKCMHYAQQPTQWRSKAVVPDVVMSTIFEIDDPMKPSKYMYGRIGNPSRNILESVLAKINRAKYGICFSSGMSALMSIFGCLKTGDHLICNHELCGETYELFNKIGGKFGVAMDFVDFNDLDAVKDVIHDKTKIIWTENPTDPTLKVIDLLALSKLAKDNKIILGVDNTYLTPFLQRPLDLGADLVLQSCTKYMNGHSDILMGAVCTNSEYLKKKLGKIQKCFGMIPSPFDCFQVLRGLKTLNLRMEEHHKSSTIIANYLEKHSAVEQVLHPGLASHPQHELFKNQTSGHSGIISFYIKGGSVEAKRFLEHLKFFTITDVAGGNESTVQIPLLMSHKSLTKSKKEQLHIKDNLIKISVGLEDTCDLICDLEQALDTLKYQKNTTEKCEV